MKKAKRRSIILITSLAVAVLLMVSLTLAYLTDFRSTLNVLGIGIGSSSSGSGSGSSSGPIRTVMIELTEEEFAKQAIAEALKNGRTYVPTVMNPGRPDEYAKVELYDIVPNMPVNKDSTVGNVGSGAVYVRFRLMSRNAAGVDTAYTYAQFDSDLKGKLGLEINSLWRQSGDGVNYYYTNNTSAHATLAPGAKAPCFKTSTAAGGQKYTFMIPANATNSDLAIFTDYLNLVVVAEAIQGAYFTPSALTSTDPWAGSGAIQAAIR